MTSFLFKEFLSFFKKLILSGIPLFYWHLLVIDGYDSLVTLETIGQVQEFELDTITPLVHTSHALKTLTLNCFKTCKTNLKGKYIVQWLKHYTKTW
jgi:hypothetical protein